MFLIAGAVGHSERSIAPIVGSSGLAADAGVRLPADLIDESGQADLVAGPLAVDPVMVYA